MNSFNNKAILIAGPEASGKTTLANGIARSLGSTLSVGFSEIAGSVFGLGRALRSQPKTIIVDDCPLGDTGLFFMRTVSSGVKLNLHERGKACRLVDTPNFIFVTQDPLPVDLTALERRFSIFDLTPKEKPKFRSYWHCVVEVDIPEGEMPSTCGTRIKNATRAALKDLHPEVGITFRAAGFALNGETASMAAALHDDNRNHVTPEDVKKRGCC